ncbi:unnamed protein product [Linum tenue]|uniref:Uncharacterized protein n=1 Tax=Linum tenue TaxID=586396 RepID=A0AAV0GRG3_9ROSI|nr:unnamed protein product [Linum tenue]
MAHPAIGNDDMPRYKFRFLRAPDLPRKCNDTTILSDAFGRLLEYSTTATHSNGTTRTVRKELQIAIPDGDKVRVTLWGDTIEQFNRIFNANENEPILLIITSVIVKEYNGLKFISSTTATRIYGNLNIPEILPENNQEPAMEVAVNPPNQYNINDQEDPPQLTIAELEEKKTDIENEHHHEGHPSTDIASSSTSQTHQQITAAATSATMMIEEEDQQFQLENASQKGKSVAEPSKLKSAELKYYKKRKASLIISDSE